jgi:hypothetical protein
MITPDPMPAPPTWRQHLVALFVTFHIVCVLIYALPRPPAVDDAILEHPEVKAELANWPSWLAGRYRDLLAVVRGYTRVTDAARRRVTTYVELIGSTQSWHMFGGTPPRFPLVFVVEVWPEGGREFMLYQDLNWGTPDSRAMNFRHRKVHENLAAWEGKRMWSAYAAYWARLWDDTHPDHPARWVRLSCTRLTTPLPQEVRAGDTDRHPETGLQSSVWERP